MRKMILLCFLVSHLFLNSSGQNTPLKMAFHSWAVTPPMGWNSWDCYGPTVTENEVKANTDYMARYLKKFGWEYIVVDIRWFVENDKAHGYNEKDAIYVMDEYGRFQPSTVRFPSSRNGNGFKPLANYVHSKGLKFGIHIMRGVPVEAVKRNTPILGSKAKAGLDYEAVKPEFFGGNAMFMVFTQDPSGPMPADSVAVPAQLDQLGIMGPCTIKDIWNNKQVGTFSHEFAPVIPRHGSGLYRLSKVK